jgi:hypothetical protein
VKYTALPAGVRETPQVADKAATSIRPRPACASAAASASTGKVRDVSWTSTRSWPNEHVTASVMVSPGS